MQKTAKSVLADALKPDVRPSHAEELLVVSFVLDGGHFLHGVIWASDCKYADVVNDYVAFVLNNSGKDTCICFGGYADCTRSTKCNEQFRRTSRKNISRDILFTLDMRVTTIQQSFIANPKKKD